ncbi:MAG: 16S rRNA (cytosine(1402)-N(4))-methyltransferase RsmH [Bdellovibrionales bacterium]|nr:16S rRNA (cytosine(1402)-N(4))-methyltransferase RsmH [Bdellovibrionales bacterium]
MNLPDDGTKPKRRKRYKGTHPRTFAEKYKEHDPERYQAAVEKIKARGKTPAGTHRPICVKEILEILNPKPGEIALDATLGYGGHAAVVLQNLLPHGRLIGIEQDAIERSKTEERLRAQGISESSLLIAPINFREARNFLKSQGIRGVDMVLADLGVSSMQLDDPTRGFSYKIDAPLDLRMNSQAGEPAWTLLHRLSESDLATLLFEYADERRARVIASALVKAKPKTTRQLADAIRAVMARLPQRVQREEGDAPIRRVFQALRIAINDEFTALDQFLEDLPHILKPHGRVAILSFHSGEDRRVKKSFRSLARENVYREIAPEIIRPSMEEQRANPRSKSAKLRWAIKG